MIRKAVMCACVVCLLNLGTRLGAATGWEQLYNEGLAARKLGHYQDARRLLENALADSGLDAQDVRRAQVAAVLASICNMLGDANRAEGLYGEAVAILHHTPEPSIESVVLSEFGSFREGQGRVDEAENLLRKAVEASRSGFGERHPQTAAAQVGLAQLYITTGRLTEAEPLLRSAIEVQRKILRAADIDRVVSETSLGVVLMLEGRYAAAEPMLQEVSRAARELGDDHPVYAMTLVNLADLYRFEGDPARGEPLLRKALAIYESKLGPDAPAVADALLDMSISSIREGKASLASSQIRRAIGILTKAYGPNHATVAIGECRLAQAIMLERRYPDAQNLLEHAVSVLGRTFSGGHRVLGECLYHMGEAAEAQHRWTDAAWRYQESIAVFERTAGPAPPTFAAALRRYARLLMVNRKAEAKSLESRAREVEKAIGRFSDR